LIKLQLFFFSSRRRHTRSKRDWSSDVCSSDLSRITSQLSLGFAYLEYVRPRGRGFGICNLQTGPASTHLLDFPNSVRKIANPRVCWKTRRYFCHYRHTVRHCHNTWVIGNPNRTGRYHRKRNRSDRGQRSEEHTSELQSRFDLVCRL